RRASGSPSRRSMRTQNEWNVLRLGAESSGTSSSKATTRSRISRAALLVKVTASTADGGAWRVVRMCAMRWVMTRVLPLPAPARISKGPSMWLTASRCCALSPLRKSMKGEPFNFSTPPGRGSAWSLALLVRATWKWGSHRVRQSNEGVVCRQVPAGCGVGMGVGGAKPIWSEVVWGEGGRDGGSSGSTTGAGSAGGSGAGAAAAAVLAWSLSMARMARSRARRVASRRYWSLEKEFGLQETDFPRGDFSGSRYMSSLWYRHAW